jgi:hypothetical protein
MMYGTVAYSAATGAPAWTRFYGVQGAQAGNGSAIAVSPDSARVYVTGSITRTSGGSDYGTIAYSAAGQRLWVSRYRTPGPFSSLNLARSLAVSPAGTVFVTGYRPGPGASGSDDYATVAYSPAGKQLWIKTFNASGTGNNVANSVTAPGNGRVYVTGSSQGAKSGLDYATIAYKD